MRIKELSIKNFRCFKDLQMESFGQFNLLTGKNNAGKTAVLEAIYLFMGHHNPELPLRISTFRGAGKVKLAPDEIWGWNFLDKDTSKTIVIEAKEEEGSSLRLKMVLAQPVDVEIALLESDDPSGKNMPDFSADTGLRKRLDMEFLVDSEPLEQAGAWIQDGKIHYSYGKSRTGSVAFLTTKRDTPGENPERFSLLTEVGREEGVLAALQVVEPRLNRLVPLISGGLQFVAGDIGLGRLMPITYMGGGTNTLLTFVLPILLFEGGVVLIDEFENGLHYSVLKDVWKAVVQASRKSNTQIFATTHSSECIQAAFEAFEELGETDVNLKRLDRRNGDIVAVDYGVEDAAAALSCDLEVR